jgi:RNA polymerase sigma factor (sigma-70 family)
MSAHGRRDGSGHGVTRRRVLVAIRAATGQRGAPGVRGLLARSQNSPHAFADFYEAMAPTILRYFARQTGNPDRAFDLLAETFAKAFEKRHDFRGDSEEQAAAWLWSIARTELAQYRRRRGVELAALARLGLERPTPTDDELRQVEQMTAAAEARARVEAAISELPREQQQVIQMRFVDQLGYDEIAAELGVSSDVARARCSRGLRTLRASDHVHEAVRALEP